MDKIFQGNKVVRVKIWFFENKELEEKIRKFWKVYNMVSQYFWRKFGANDEIVFSNELGY